MIRIQTELSKCAILNVTYQYHTHSVPHKGENIMTEMPLNVAKCLFFRNVLNEKLIGEEKALQISCLFERFILHSMLPPFFPLGKQILNDKTIWRKSA